MNASTVYNALVSSKLAHELESLFVQATGLPVELLPIGEPARLISSQRRENPFCGLMSQFTHSCMACKYSHTALLQRLADDSAPQVTCCFAGLTEFAVPVVAGGQLVATLLGGQVFQRKPSQAQFTRLTEQLRSWGMHRELRRIEKVYFQTRVISRNQFQASVRLLTIIATLLAKVAHHDLLSVHNHDQPCIANAKTFIREHAGEQLYLVDVAEHLHVSTSHFCKFFKKATGMGFSEFLTRVRIENAKVFLANSDLLINEVASQAGFGSLSQFNRAFQRYVGCSPKEYRASPGQSISF